MKKIIFTLLLMAVALPFGANAASVTIENIPTVCSSAIFRGTASYSAPDTLTVKLNGASIYSTSSGESTWQVTSSGPFIGNNSLTVEVSSSTAGVIASASASFGMNCGNQDPMAVTQVWGLTGYETPVVFLGTVVTDKYGYHDTCTYKNGCFDISGTEYYLSDIVKFFLHR